MSFKYEPGICQKVCAEGEGDQRVAVIHLLSFQSRYSPALKETVCRTKEERFLGETVF